LIVVVDSGVWISAFQFEGVPLLAIERILVGHRVAVCTPILGEIRKTLVKKFGWSRGEVDEVFDFYLARAIHIEISGHVSGVCRDPNDDMVIECAEISGAEMIVSGDKDLLAVKRHRGIRVLTPRAFLESEPGY
jgi:putative PIN family toxin of toxin-antitoxin system